MKKRIFIISITFLLFCTAFPAFAAYHHQGEADSDKFLQVYPSKIGTKLDHCALCHSGGQYKKGDSWVNLGSCQWCHHSYGYGGTGNIIDTLNEYGMAYLTHGRDAEAVVEIKYLDSDGDGYNNHAEIQANRYPGDDQDDPGKKVAPYRIYTKAQLEAMPRHTQFLLLNTSRSGDFYAQYTGVVMEDLLQDAGILPSATGIKVYAPDGWMNYHPMDPDPDPELYHVRGTYPEASFQYDAEADTANVGWCDYSAPSCSGRNHGDPIYVEGGLKMILAYKRDGAYLTPGVLNTQNKLDGEGPFRLVPPQKTPGPPDQSSTSGNQSVIWPHNHDWDHNAGSSSRTVTIIKVEPLPPGTTDIDVLEAGWQYVDGEKIIIYGDLESEDKDQGGNNGSQANIRIPSLYPYNINSPFTVYPMSGYVGGFGSPYPGQSLGGFSPFGIFGNYPGTGISGGGYIPGTFSSYSSPSYYSGLSQFSGPYQPFSLYSSQPFSYSSPF
ncbi:MAG: GEGP motif-containing diheme protein [bacterium]